MAKNQIVLYTKFDKEIIVYDYSIIWNNNILFNIFNKVIFTIGNYVHIFLISLNKCNIFMLKLILTIL
jgi:hypothetical protein